MVCKICGLTGHNSSTCGKKIQIATPIAPVAPGPKASELVSADVWNNMGILIEKANDVAKGLSKGRAENVYQSALSMELQDMKVRYTSEETIPVVYKGVTVGFERMDICLLSWFNVIIELKAVASDIKADNHFQVLNYMKYKDYKYGMVLNFCQGSGKPVQIDYVMRDGADVWLIDWKMDVANKLINFEFE